MSKHQTSRLRAPRVTVPNNEQVVVNSVESKPVVGILMKLSTTGGLLRVPKSYVPGAFGEIALKTASGRKITAAIEFLRTGVNGAGSQAFRFIQIEPADRRRLEDALDQMRKNGLGEKRGAFRPLAYLSRFLG